MDINPCIVFYAAGPTSLSNRWFTDLYHKERNVSVVQQFCFLDHFHM